MDQERIGFLNQLIDLSLHGNQEQINDATKYLMSEIGNPDAIFDFIQLFEISNDSTIRLGSSIYINKIIVKMEIFENEINGDNINRLKETIVSLINKENTIGIQKIFVFSAAKLFSKIPNNWPELIDIALDYMSTEQYVVAGFDLWSEICLLVQEDINVANANRVINEFIKSASNPKEDVRISALQMLSVFLTCVEPEVFNECSENLPGVLMTLIEGTLTLTPSVNECLLLFDLVYLLIMKEIPIFLDNAFNFLDVALQISDSKLDSVIRYSCQNLMTLAPLLMGDGFEEHLPNYLQSCISLAVEICKQSHNEMSIDFVTHFIDSIIRNTNISEVLIPMLIESETQSIADADLEQVYVGLHALMGTIEGGSDELASYSAQLIEIVKACLVMENSLVFDACCTFLVEISQNNPSVISSGMDEIIDILFVELSEPMSISTLDKLMFNSEKPPLHVESIVNNLVQLLSNSSSEHHSSIVSCLSSSISKYEGINAQLYSTICQVLNELLTISDSDVRGLVFECYGFLAKISPQQVLEDMETLINSLNSSFSPDNDQINEYIAVCISSIAKVLPIGFKSHASAMIPYFLELLKKDIPTNNDENEEEEESDTISGKMHASVLTAVATIINEIPNVIESCIPEFVDILISHLDSIIPIQLSAIKSIFLMTDGLKRIGYNIESMFSVVIDKLPKTTDTSVEAELLLSLGGLFICYNQLSEEHIQESLKFFRDAFSGEVSSIYNGSKSIDPSVVFQLFFALRQFIMALGNKLSNYGDEIISILSPYMGSNKKIIKAYSAHTIAVIALECPSIEFVAEIAQGASLSMINIKEDGVKNIVLSTLNILVHAQKDVFTKKHISQIVQVTESLIKSSNSQTDMLTGTAVTLWCSICSIYHHRVDNNMIRKVFELLPPVIDDDDIPFTAIFLIYASRNYPNEIHSHIHRIAINIFASGDWCTRNVSREIMNEISSIVKEIPQDELEEFVKWNQHHLLQIQSNIAHYSQ